MKKIVGRDMVFVAAVMGLGVLAMSMLQPVLPLYLTEIGFTPEIVGLMLSAAMLGMVIGESYWGWAADKVGLRIPLSVGTFVCALVVFTFVLTQHVAAIFVIFFFWGLVRSAIFGPGLGYIAASAPPLKRATYLAMIIVTASASRSIGALPGGFIADNLGHHAVFFVSCGVSFLGGIVMLVGLRKMRRMRSEASTSSPQSSELPPTPQRVFCLRPLIFPCVVTFLQLCGVGIFFVFLPLLATQVVGLAATQVGILFTIRWLGTTALAIPMGILADRKGKKIFVTLGLLATAGGMAGLAFAGNFPWLVVSVIATSFGFAMYSPAMLGLISDSVPLRQQGTAMGVYGGICENIGVIVGSSVGGFVWSAWGPQVLFLMGAATTALGAVLCSAWIREKRSKICG